MLVKKNRNGELLCHLSRLNLRCQTDLALLSRSDRPPLTLKCSVASVRTCNNTLKSIQFRDLILTSPVRPSKASALEHPPRKRLTSSNITSSAPARSQTQTKCFSLSANRTWVRQCSLRLSRFHCRWVTASSSLKEVTHLTKLSGRLRWQPTCRKTLRLAF